MKKILKSKVLNPKHTKSIKGGKNIIGIEDFIGTGKNLNPIGITDIIGGGKS